MAKLPSTFKRKDHGKMADFSAVPAGEYIAKITSSKYEANSKKTGHGLTLVFEIQNKEFKGKKVFTLLNLDNPNEQTVEMANNEFATICDAAGKGTVKDSDQLHGIPMIITVKLVPAEGKWPEKNEISMYDKMDSKSGDSDDELEEEDDPDEVADPEDDPEESVDEEEDEKEESDSDITVESVQEQAREYKKENNLKALKKMLGEYDIEKISQIGDLDEDDLEALHEDFEDEL